MEDMDKIKRNPVSESIANEILKNYNPESVEDMQEALKDIFGPMFKGLLKGELNHHLGYEYNSNWLFMDYAYSWDYWHRVMSAVYSEYSCRFSILCIIF